MKLSSSIIFCLLLKITVFAQANFVLKMKIESIKEKYALLWRYHGDKELLVDSVRFGANGLAIYRTKTAQPFGLYRIQLPNTRSFELIISEPKIALTTNVITSDQSMKIKKSVENKIYYELKRFISSQRKKLFALSKDLKKQKISQTQFDHKTDSINQAIRTRKLGIIAENPNLLVSAYIKAEMNPLIDQSVKEPYIKYINDFLDQIDFNNPAILNSPILEDRVNEYVQNIVAPYPSEKIKAIDRILKRTDFKPTRTFLATKFLRKYQEMSQLGDDEVFLHLVENYLNDSDIKEKEIIKYKKQAQDIKPFLRGKQFPENSFVLDKPLDSIIAKYTLVVIWNESVTKKQLNLLYDFSQSYAKYGLKVLSISVNSNKEKLHIGHKNNWYHGQVYTYLNDLPFRENENAFELYFLDKNKKIIARDIGLDDLIDTIDAWEK